MRRLLLAAATAALLLTACGDDDAPAASSPAASSPAASSPAADSVAPDDAGTTDPSATVDTIAEGAGDGTEFCDINEEMNEYESPLDDELPDPAELEQYFTTVFPEQFGRLKAAAPEELVGDLAVLEDGLAMFAEVLAANEWEIEAAYADPALTAVFADETFNQAGERLDAYCGFDS